MLFLPLAPQPRGGSSVLHIHSGSRMPSGSPPSAGPPGQLAISGPWCNGTSVQGDRWQLCQPDRTAHLTCTLLCQGWGKGPGDTALLPTLAFTQDLLISFAEYEKYFISYLRVSFLSQIVPDRMLFHLLKIWGSCPPLLETVLLPLIPEEL